MHRHLAISVLVYHLTEMVDMSCSELKLNLYVYREVWSVSHLCREPVGTGLLMAYDSLLKLHGQVDSICALCLGGPVFRSQLRDW
jgi:hypothetical protein